MTHDPPHPSASDGPVVTVDLPSWGDFYAFVEERACWPKRLLWRGHRCDDWELTSTLHRLFKRLGLLSPDPKFNHLQTTEHLRAFLYAARGRRGISVNLRPIVRAGRRVSCPAPGDDVARHGDRA